MKISLLFIINVQMLSSTIFMHSAMVQKLSQLQFCLMNINKQLPQDVELNDDEKEAFDRIRKALLTCNDDISGDFYDHVDWTIVTNIINVMNQWFGAYLHVWWSAGHRRYGSMTDRPAYPKKGALQQYIQVSYETVIEQFRTLNIRKNISVVEEGKTYSILREMTPLQERMFGWLQSSSDDFNKIRKKIFTVLKIRNGNRNVTGWSPMLNDDSSTGALGEEKDWKKLGLLKEYEKLERVFMFYVAEQLLKNDYSSYNKFRFLS